MKKASDTKVRKTLVRDSEKKLNTARNKVVREVNSKIPVSNQSKDLNKPTLCSSEALSNYISDVKTAKPLPTTELEHNINHDQINAKVTKQLNFHFNDKIYRNLIELNSHEENKKIKAKRPSSTSNKRDLEPNIEDFHEETTDNDIPPFIPVIKPKFQMVKKVENGQLHRIVAAFENL